MSSSASSNLEHGRMRHIILYRSECQWLSSPDIPSLQLAQSSHVGNLALFSSGAQFHSFMKRQPSAVVVFFSFPLRIHS